MDDIIEKLRRCLRLEEAEEISVMDLLYGCYGESLQIVEKEPNIKACKRNAFELGVRVGISLIAELNKGLPQ